MNLYHPLGRIRHHLLLLLHHHLLRWHCTLRQTFASFCNMIRYTGVLISPQPDQEGNNLQRPNSNFCKPLKNNSEGCPSNQVFAAALTSASEEKWRPFNYFFQSDRAKDLSAPLQCHFVFSVALTLQSLLDHCVEHVELNCIQRVGGGSH